MTARRFMRHSIAKYLEDVRLSIEDIENYTVNIKDVAPIQSN